MLYHTNSRDHIYTTILIDLNGTLTVYGELDPSIPEMIAQLHDLGYRIVLLTGDQRGNRDMFAGLGIEIVYAADASAKRNFALSCDTSQTIAIGNARIDIGIFEVVGLRIATLQAEGIHAGILPYVDVIVPSMQAALQMLIDPAVFAATMKI